MLLSTIVSLQLSCNSNKQLRKDSNLEMTKLLQNKLDSLTSNKVVPGATFAVLFHNGESFSLASGLADVENQIPMQPDALMFSGSVGKTYVATVVLKLYAQGLLDIKAKSIDYLKDETWFLKVPNAKYFTIEMLLNHTAGIPEYVYKKELWQKITKDLDKEWTVEDRLSFIFNEQPANEPGKAWAYADAHYLVLGSIIEKVTGKTYYEALDELILRPYHLTNTIPSNKREIPGLVTAGYTQLTEDFLLPHKVLNEGKYAFNPQTEWTGGGLASTVTDLTLWAKQLYGGEVLSHELKKLMLTPAPYATTLFENARYGLGCFIGETHGIRYYGHTGFVPGYITIMQYLPDYDLAMAFQINTDSLHGDPSKIIFNDLKAIVLRDSKQIHLISD